MSKPNLSALERLYLHVAARQMQETHPQIAETAHPVEAGKGEEVSEKEIVTGREVLVEVIQRLRDMLAQGLNGQMKLTVLMQLQSAATLLNDFDRQ